MSKSKTRSNAIATDWDREDIKAAIRKKERLSMAAFAKRNGYENPATFYNVFKAPYPKIGRIIAKYLEVEPAEIWPSRYANRTTEIRDVFGTNARVA